jgi:hypothetical protein
MILALAVEDALHGRDSPRLSDARICPTIDYPDLIFGAEGNDAGIDHIPAALSIAYRLQMSQARLSASSHLHATHWSSVFVSILRIFALRRLMRAGTSFQ